MIKLTNILTEMLQEACWDGYEQQGMKKKGDKMVPNCVRVSEAKKKKKSESDDVEGYEDSEAPDYANAAAAVARKAGIPEQVIQETLQREIENGRDRAGVRSGSAGRRRGGPRRRAWNADRAGAAAGRSGTSRGAGARG